MTKNFGFSPNPYLSSAIGLRTVRRSLKDMIISLLLSLHQITSKSNCWNVRPRITSSPLSVTPEHGNVFFCACLIWIYSILWNLPCLIQLYYVQWFGFLLSKLLKAPGNHNKEKHVTPELSNPPTILSSASICIQCGRLLCELTDHLTHTRTQPLIIQQKYNDCNESTKKACVERDFQLYTTCVVDTFVTACSPLFWEQISLKCLTS